MCSIGLPWVEFLVEFLSVAQLRLLGLAAPHLAVPELDFWLQFLAPVSTQLPINVYLGSSINGLSIWVPVNHRDTWLWYGLESTILGLTMYNISIVLNLCLKFF